MIPLHRHYLNVFSVTTAQCNLELSYLNKIMCQPLYNNKEKILILELVRNKRFRVQTLFNKLIRLYKDDFISKTNQLLDSNNV